MSKKEEEGKVSYGSAITVILSLILTIILFWFTPIKDANMEIFFWIFLISGIIGVIISVIMGFIIDQFNFRYDLFSIIFSLMIFFFFRNLNLGDILIPYFLLLIFLSGLISWVIMIGIGLLFARIEEIFW